MFQFCGEADSGQRLAVVVGLVASGANATNVGVIGSERDKSRRERYVSWTS